MTREPTPAPRGQLSILLLVVAANQRLGQLVDRELAAEGVDPNGYALLSLVGVRAPVSLTAVAGELGMPLTTASDAMRRLEARGHVARGPNPEDGRSVVFGLTAAGNDEWRRGWPALRRIDGFLTRELDDHEGVRGALEGLGAAFAAALARTRLFEEDTDS